MLVQGFSYDSPARTFRRSSGGCTQIVNFQVGVRTMEGKFTVNLGVFHQDYHQKTSAEVPAKPPRESDCLMEFRRRLSVLRYTPVTAFFQSLIHNHDSFLKWWLVTPIDKWWAFTSDEPQVAKQLTCVRELLFTRGLEWLNQNSDVTLLGAAHEKLKPKVT
ncbi:MAG: DUF4304 domain-containing protein [Limisphaerales bacterium]